jgi:hypothetical protein
VHLFTWHLCTSAPLHLFISISSAPLQYLFSTS